MTDDPAHPEIADQDAIESVETDDAAGGQREQRREHHAVQCAGPEDPEPDLRQGVEAGERHEDEREREERRPVSVREDVVRRVPAREAERHPDRRKRDREPDSVQRVATEDPLARRQGDAEEVERCRGDEDRVDRDSPRDAARQLRPAPARSPEDELEHDDDRRRSEIPHRHDREEGE